jgi:hypothetical protein
MCKYFIRILRCRVSIGSLTPDFERQRIFQRAATDFSESRDGDFLAELMNIYSIYVYYLVGARGQTARQT